MKKPSKGFILAILFAIGLAFVCREINIVHNKIYHVSEIREIKTQIQNTYNELSEELNIPLNENGTFNPENVKHICRPYGWIDAISVDCIDYSKGMDKIAELEKELKTYEEAKPVLEVTDTIKISLGTLWISMLGCYVALTFTIRVLKPTMSYSSDVIFFLTVIFVLCWLWMTYQACILAL